MRIIQIDIEEIKFTPTPYQPSLLASIQRMGLSFPIKVVLEDNQYYCQDGHKRLSAISEIIKKDPLSKRRKINVIVVNNGNSRSNDCWRSRNTH